MQSVKPETVASAVAHLNGLLWCLNMYLAGVCPSYAWTMATRPITSTGTSAATNDAGGGTAGSDDTRSHPVDGALSVQQLTAVLSLLADCR